jgi:acetyl-CoA carboxylase beta subunit
MDERLPESGLTSRSARAALAAVATDLVYIGSDPVSQDPLRWPGYQEQLRAAEARSGETESVVVAEGTVGGRRVTLVGFQFDFLGGSMGEATGERITQAFAHSRARRQPLVSLVASGGARMQEGMRSLVQMQRLAAACAEARKEGIPHISVVRNPTTGGVWVSLASTADVILGVTGANVSFAGSRVRGDAGDESRFFTARGKQASGFIDAETSAQELPALLDRYIALLGDRAEPTPCPVPVVLGAQAPPATGWQAVQRARSDHRPRALACLDRYFTERVPISGDRAGGKDEGMLCGFGRRDGHTVAYAAQTGSRNSAAGFRTATRLFRLAERLRVPVLTLIDTPGAEHTATAEQAGIGTAIGETFVAVSELSVPVTSLVIGEGGSGGALALAAPGRLWATPDSYFSVIAPEGAAAILYRDSSRAADAAHNLRLGPADLVALGISEGVTES